MARSILSASDEGTYAGAIGAAAVALWFLVFDAIVAFPLRTPSVLGQVMLFGVDEPVADQPVVGAVFAYTAFHFGVFMIFGIAVAALVRWALREPVVRYALLQVFLVFEVFFYGVLVMVSEETRLLVPFWAVLGANTLAAVLMALYFWRLHPELRRAIREVPLGAAGL